MSKPLSDVTETIAARLTLGALRKISPAIAESDDPAWYQILPSLAPLTFEESISKLSQLPKPLTCVGFSIANGFALCNWPVGNEYLRRMEMTRAFAEGIRTDLVADEQDHLLVDTVAEHFAVSPDQLVDWLARYYLPHVQMSFGGERDTSDARVLHFHPISGGSKVMVRENE